MECAVRTAPKLASYCSPFRLGTPQFREALQHVLKSDDPAAEYDDDVIRAPLSVDGNDPNPVRAVAFI
jgi:hypothetical protein